MPFTVLDHTADLHVRIEAPSLEELFIEAARAMVAQMFPSVLSEQPENKCVVNDVDLKGSTPSSGKVPFKNGNDAPLPNQSTVERELMVSLGEPLPSVDGELDGETQRLPAVWEDLFHDWLSKVLVLCTADRLLPIKYRVTFEKEGLHGRIVARPLDPQRDTGEIEIKAVTYHGLKLERTPGGYRAEVIFDT
ncbi:MAG: archease [Thermogutta sp.]|jgi:SHS2 domain-containing protein